MVLLMINVDFGHIVDCSGRHVDSSKMPKHFIVRSQIKDDYSSPAGARAE